MTTFREPTDSERAILARLLDVDFVGRAELTLMMRGILVCQVDHNGSLDCKVNSIPMHRLFREYLLRQRERIATARSFISSYMSLTESRLN